MRMVTRLVRQRCSRSLIKICAWLLLAGAALGAMGCGDSAPQADLERARAALATSLDAWKTGMELTPEQGRVVQFTDPDQIAGLRLVNYTIERCAGQRGENFRCWTKLDIENADGGTAHREVVFEIKLGDKTTIGRDPFN